MRSAVLILCLLTSPLLWAADAETPQGRLQVTVNGLKSSQGSVRLALFKGKENFLKNVVDAAIVEIDDETCVWEVPALAYGEYAVAVYHDENGNGKMDRYFYGKPKEPNGFSNDAPARFGPPKWKHARFVLDQAKKQIVVNLK